MSADKTYAWEKAKFPWHFGVKIKYEHRHQVAVELAQRFGIKDLHVRLDRRGGGDASVMERRIRLPNWNHKCSLGLILHEIAHVYDWRHYEGNGHRASFKRAMIKLCVETRVMRLLLPIYAKIRDEHRQALARMRAHQERSQRVISAAQRAADRKTALKAEKKTPQYRLDRARARAKTLATRIKRLQTAQKKAERQIRALERSVVRSAPGQHAVPEEAVPAVRRVPEDRG